MIERVEVPEKHWFQTYTGKIFHPFDPDPKMIDIEDIAHALSLICRFSGHVKEFYSVAEHSVHVARVFDELVKDTSLEGNHRASVCALLHDATETYCGDMIRPIKEGIIEYQKMEAEIEEMVIQHFGLVDVWWAAHPYVKQADNIMLATERRDLLTEGPGRDDRRWVIDEQGVKASERHVFAMHPEDAKEWFLGEYGLFVSREEQQKAL